MAIVDETQAEAGEVQDVRPMWEHLTPVLLKSLRPQQIGRTPSALTQQQGRVDDQPSLTEAA